MHSENVQLSLAVKLHFFLFLLFSAIILIEVMLQCKDSTQNLRPAELLLNQLLHYESTLISHAQASVRLRKKD